MGQACFAAHAVVSSIAADAVAIGHVHANHGDCAASACQVNLGKRQVNGIAVVHTSLQKQRFWCLLCAQLTRGMA